MQEPAVYESFRNNPNQYHIIRVSLKLRIPRQVRNISSREKLWPTHCILLGRCEKDQTSAQPHYLKISTETCVSIKYPY
jgi:hypothetical protein